MAYQVAETCTACGKCKSVCPVEAIMETEDKKFKIDPEICVECGVCVDECPSKAIVKM